MDSVRKLLAGAAFAGALLSCGAAFAECVSAPDLGPAPPIQARNVTGSQTPFGAGYSASGPNGAAGPTRSDRHGRVIAPVMVNGQGPFRFIVDTGANRSVLSTTLAQVLGLTANSIGNVHSINSVDPAPLVDVRTLDYGPVALANASLPILGEAMMGGEQGVLGVDGMRGKRLRLDFDRRCIEIIPSSGAPSLLGWARLQGELKFGHLVVVPGRVNNVRVNVIIDTGSDVSLANIAFRTAIDNARMRSSPQSFARAYTAGRPIILDRAIIVPQMRLSSVNVTDLTFFVGDFHIFDLWGYRDQPTVLIGMDVLSHAHAIAIDYERGTVHIRVPT